MKNELNPIEKPMLETPISRLLFKMSFSMMIAMTVKGLYYLVDPFPWFVILARTFCCSRWGRMMRSFPVRIITTR